MTTLGPSLLMIGAAGGGSYFVQPVRPAHETSLVTLVVAACGDKAAFRLGPGR